jgi:hypothetical protein
VRLIDVFVWSLAACFPFHLLLIFMPNLSSVDLATVAPAAGSRGCQFSWKTLQLLILMARGRQFVYGSGWLIVLSKPISANFYAECSEITKKVSLHKCHYARTHGFIQSIVTNIKQLFDDQRVHRHISSNLFVCVYVP